MQADCRLAARVIRVLLRQTSPTDIFTVNAETGLSAR
jgi:hypothetical protein